VGSCIVAPAGLAAAPPTKVAPAPVRGRLLPGIARPPGHRVEPMLSVIVPATNEPATLPRCLEALSAAMGDHDELVLLREGLGQSPARLRNDGARHAQGDVLVFVDADVVVHPDALELLRQAFASDARLTAAFGSYDRHPPAGVVSEFRNLLHRHVHRENAGEACTFWAGLGAIRRPAFLATGGFDEVAFPRPMLEDVELGLRLSGQGHRTAVMPEVQGRHLKRWTLRAMLSSDAPFTSSITRARSWRCLSAPRATFVTAPCAHPCRCSLSRWWPERRGLSLRRRATLYAGTGTGQVVTLIRFPEALLTRWSANSTVTSVASPNTMRPRSNIASRTSCSSASGLRTSRQPTVPGSR
jgi:cellulose synthase/poly-beta-1,6-N-acetylglucosamine synthase-like glycosyltransferase